MVFEMFFANYTAMKAPLRFWPPTDSCFSPFPRWLSEFASPPAATTNKTDQPCDHPPPLLSSPLLSFLLISHTSLGEYGTRARTNKQELKLRPVSLLTFINTFYFVPYTDKSVLQPNYLIIIKLSSASSICQLAFD